MWNHIKDFLQRANLRTLGMLTGAILGVLYLIVGFWKSIVFAGFIVAGYLVGRWLDSQEDWRDVVERLIPNKTRD
ncbi:DUF2273 domain-containing protein [Effusibacillus lacus]|uniref:DUF2273 domain-containing protein n=1 Tax=Effusibacillus lacus TaxID=1348429 RepID=A0A292YE17_9BACL|nr:DUF2273 domain-containing protein [Effusibacillus lacus]GAX90912.1 hypothetical protein EFBL_2554 [Effusibacillus lacus]